MVCLEQMQLKRVHLLACRLALKALDAFRAAKIFSQVLYIHGAGGVTKPTLAALVLDLDQAQGGDLVERSQNSSQWAEIFTPETPAEK